MTRVVGGGLLLLAVLSACGSAEEVRVQPPGGDQPIPATYFGVQLHGDLWPTVPFGSSRVQVMWKLVEPERGKWDFNEVDKQVDLALTHHAEVLMDLGLTPPWASSKPHGECKAGVGNCWAPTSMQDWRDYISAVARRYQGRVRYYQVWNEPNQAEFWQDTMENMIALTKAAHEILKGVDASNMVLSPAPAGRRAIPWFNEFLTKGGKRYFDIFAFHIYPSPEPPESLIGQMQQLREVFARDTSSHRSMWDTEAGWWTPGAELTDAEQAAYAARIIILEHIAGISRLFWYIWDFQGAEIVMLDRNGQLSPAAQGYATLHQWLAGATMPSCSSADVPTEWRPSHSMWSCDVVRNGVTSKIVWNPDGDRQFHVPSEWQINQTESLAGEAKPMPQSKQITIGIQPTLLLHR